ncbi:MULTISPECIES: type IX secretion system protein PorD [Chitinophagaceae]
MRFLYRIVIIGCMYITCCIQPTKAQEFQAKVSVLSQQVTNTVAKSNFTTLQTQLTNLINNRAWTSDKFLPQERIQCTFLLNVTSADDQGYCKAILTVQAARPVYNSGYLTQLINYQDNDVVFRYLPNQNMDFNENRVSGSDPLVSNLTAIIAFYLDVILGYHYDSFAPNGGAVYFKKAQNIVVAAPQSNDITGWQSFNSTRNRYWISENLNNPRYNMLPTFLYNYFRKGMDLMYDVPTDAQSNLYQALLSLQQMNQQNPNTMFVQMFMQQRYQELAGAFNNASPQIKSSAKELLSQLDPANAYKYSNL